MNDLTRKLSATVLLVLAATSGVARAAGTTPLTRARLEALRSSSNDPSGDSFIDSKSKLNDLIDAFAADSSLASPMLLYLAANTAFRLGRIEDSGFLLYAAQLRKAFDFQRYDISREPNGNNAATYLAFLNQTIGQSVNPAIMGQPKSFSSAIRRIEVWEVVPSAQAFYPDFQEAKGFKLKEPEWAAAAKAIKDEFLKQFGRRFEKLLSDPQYFEAFQFVQGVNLGRINAADPKNMARLAEMSGRMTAIERKLDAEAVK